MGHVNINSLRKKFEMLQQIVQDKLNIFLVSETKADPSFLSSQFATEGFGVPFQLDKNNSGDGIMLLVREEIPSKLLSQYTYRNNLQLK